MIIFNTPARTCPQPRLAPVSAFAESTGAGACGDASTGDRGVRFRTPKQV